MIDNIFSLSDAEREYENLAEFSSHGLSITGFPSIDRKIREFRPGEVACLEAATGNGKTTVSLNWAQKYTIESGQPTLIFSLEMPVRDIYERIIQIRMDLSGEEVEKNYAENNLGFKTRVSQLLAELHNLHIVGANELPLKQIKSKIQKAENEIFHAKPGLIVIDYISQVLAGGRDMYEQTSRAARGLKSLAKDMNVPILFLSQVPKSYTIYDTLTLGSARDSGAIEEASDFVLALNRVRGRSTDDFIKLNLEILKNRKGGLTKVPIKLYKKNLRTEEDEGI